MTSRLCAGAVGRSHAVADLPRSHRLRRVRVYGAFLVALATTPMPLFPQFGRVTHQLGAFATLSIPRKARLEKPHPVLERGTWVGFRFNRFHTWAMGSGTPYRSVLFVNLHAADAPTSSYDEAWRDTERELNGGGEGWKVVERGGPWLIGQGIYTVNVREPIWRLSWRDPAKHMSMVWQVYQRDWRLDDARRALLEIAASLRRTGNPDFAGIADRPRRQAAENDRKRAAAFALLSSRGFGELKPGVPQTVDGVTAERMVDPEPRVMLYRALSGPPAGAVPQWVSHGVRSWSDTGWVTTMSNDDYYPMPGTRAWLDRTQARPGPHHFIIRTVRLDELAEDAYHLADFLAYAASIR